MKRKHGDHPNHERWLVSYADFITLLFAFFVVMYALSMENLSKVKAAAESIRKAFGGPAVVAGSGQGLRGDTTVSPFESSPQPKIGPDAPAGTPEAQESQKQMQEMKDQLEEASTLETGATDLSERLDAVFDKRGLVIRLAAKDFFGREEAVVREDLLPLLDRVGRVIAQSRRPLRIEGFSDPTEARPRHFASGWELSSARAAWVAKYWIARFKLDPALVTVAGRAHFSPLQDEKNADSEWALGRNRRVEIVIPQ